MTKLDILWVLSHYCKIPNTPMWIGFNSKIIEDNSMKQRISYLTPINASPTNISVVYETMRQSQQIARMSTTINASYVRFGYCKNSIANTI